MDLIGLAGVKPSDHKSKTIIKQEQGLKILPHTYMSYM